MGQKVNPTGFRICVDKNWRSRWYAGKRDFGNLLHEDLLIRGLVKKKLSESGIAEIFIERYANRARVTIHVARPGLVIGRKGQELEKLRDDIAALTGKEIYVDVQEVKNPDMDAQLVAENICVQLERRISFRRAMKRAMQLAMELGAKGIRVQASGRLGGAELARREGYRQGSVPLHTLRANVKYGFSEAMTMAGKIGVKVWICQPTVIAEKERTYATNA